MMSNTSVRSFPIVRAEAKFYFPASIATYVVTHGSADDAVASLADLLSGRLSFSGDDAISLVHNDAVIDRLGQVGADPGSEWGTGTTLTQDSTLRRHTDV